MLEVELNIALYCDGDGCNKSVQYIDEGDITFDCGYIDGSYVSETDLEKWGWDKDPTDEGADLCPECYIKAVAADPEAVEVPVGCEAEQWRKAMLSAGHKPVGS